MQRKIAKIIFTALLLFIPFTLVAAKKAGSDEKIYILRINSFLPDQPVFIRGSVFLYNGESSTSRFDINQLTPYELPVSARMIAVVVGKENGPLIKVDISEKNENQAFTRIAAMGHIIIARQSADGSSYLSVN